MCPNDLPWDPKDHYYSLNQYLQNQFGEKVYKIALDAGMTCPNRDGTVGFGGCLFCSAGGSGEFAEGDCGDIAQQIRRAKERLSAKTKARRFIAYFQSYTNTYAPVSRLRQIFEAAIAQPEVAALSIATRPDCLPEDVVELLAELNQRKPVWVELGLQTIHEETAKNIRRGYALPVYEDALTRLHRRGIQVIAHVILGLPGETQEQMLETMDYLGNRGRPDGVKLQLLHILKGTDLAQWYLDGRVKAMEMDEYFALLFRCIQRLPPDLVIHRLTGDGPKRLLIAPQWTGDKKRVLNEMRRQMDLYGVVQGKHYKKAPDRG